MTQETFLVIRLLLIGTLTSAGLLIAVGNVTAAGPALHGPQHIMPVIGATPQTLYRHLTGPVESSFR